MTALGCDVDDPELLLARAELALDAAWWFGDVNLETRPWPTPAWLTCRRDGWRRATAPTNPEDDGDVLGRSGVNGVGPD